MFYFVNLPLSYAYNQPDLLELFLQRGIHPELGMDTDAVQAIPEQWHKQTAKRFHDAGLSCAIHLPFFDLSPGSLNSAIHAASHATLQHAAELATYYTPRHFVGHPLFDAAQHAPQMEIWLERSTQTWSTLRSIAPNVPLYLENVYEKDPAPLAKLIDHLQEHLPNTKTSPVGICLDIGHWFSFGHGSLHHNLDHWLNTLHQRICHMHLHDNDGTMDQHLGLGEGDIPLDEIFSGLQARNISPTITLEPHEEEAFAISANYLANSPTATTTFS